MDGRKSLSYWHTIERMSGILYVVATPIGNLEDITYRAVRTLGEAGVIACEDTRQTRKLLDHYGIDRPLLSYHEHNEASRSEELVRRLAGGETVALVSDAGTPLISDPGYRLVTKAVAEGITVVPIPGPSAAMTALAASGLPTDSFWFAGFLPHKPGQRQKALESFRALNATIVLYEAPHRILESLEEIERTLGDRPVVVARELTKLHEEILRGTASSVRETLASRPAIKGEITLLIGKGVQPPSFSEPVKEAVEKRIAGGSDRMEAIKEVARERGLSKREVYREFTGRD